MTGAGEIVASEDNPYLVPPVVNTPVRRSPLSLPLFFLQASFFLRLVAFGAVTFFGRAIDPEIVSDLRQFTIVSAAANLPSAVCLCLFCGFFVIRPSDYRHFVLLLLLLAAGKLMLLLYEATTGIDVSRVDPVWASFTGIKLLYSVLDGALVVLLINLAKSVNNSRLVVFGQFTFVLWVLLIGASLVISLKSRFGGPWSYSLSLWASLLVSATIISILKIVLTHLVSKSLDREFAAQSFDQPKVGS